MRAPPALRSAAATAWAWRWWTQLSVAVSARDRLSAANRAWPAASRASADASSSCWTSLTGVLQLEPPLQPGPGKLEQRGGIGAARQLQTSSAQPRAAGWQTQEGGGLTPKTAADLNTPHDKAAAARRAQLGGWNAKALLLNVLYSLQDLLCLNFHHKLRHLRPPLLGIVAHVQLRGPDSCRRAIGNSTIQAQS